MKKSPSHAPSADPGRYAPDLFLFDFDGTIADTFEISHSILNQLALEFRFRTLAREELEHVRTLSTRDFIRHLGISSWRVPGISRKGLRLMQERIAEVEPIAGIPEVLEQLHRRGHRIGILTSNSETNVLDFIARHRLPYFHFVRTSSKLFGKAREMRRILKAEGIPAERVVYVGDETRDIEAAQETGLRMAAVEWGYNAPAALSALNPHHLLSHPGELLQIGNTGA
jgi:phosphoglycolate phosphatase